MLTVDYLNQYVLPAFLVLATLPFLALIVREVIHRLRAGPVRFRLGLASRKGSPANKAVNVPLALMFLCALLMLITDFKSTWPYVPLFLPLIVEGLFRDRPGRDAKRVLVGVSGLLYLSTAAVSLAVGAGAIPLQHTFFSNLPRAFWLAVGLIWAITGVSAIREAIVGTLVREGGIEMFALTYPWSRIVVKGWQDRDGECALQLTAGLSVRKVDVVIPVPPDERAALAEFLNAHAVAAERAEHESAKLREFLRASTTTAATQDARTP